jgi:putative glycosyltransferase (TIGR04372 family)
LLNYYFMKFRRIYDGLPKMSYGVFNKKFPIIIAKLLNFSFRNILFLIPTSSIKILPKRYRYLIFTSADSLKLKKKKIEKISKLEFHTQSLELVQNLLHSKNYYESGIIPDFTEILNRAKRQTNKIHNKTIKDIVQWSFWTLNHEDFNKINKLVKEHLKSLEPVHLSENRRFLPQHTSNLGHIAFLFLYINYYRIRDPNRTIVLPRKESANDYFLNLVIRQSPLRIVFEDEKIFDDQPPTMIDTLHYSREPNGEYRTESDCAFFSDNQHPEFKVDEAFVLKLSEEEQSIGQEIFNSALGERADWYVALHVREPKNRDLTFSQARDANVETYRKLAFVVKELGGEVIRMGDKSFPKLKKGFPAYDYAHSKIKSDFMDVWLWANMRYWVGNVNGAAFPAIAFNKRRILTNQWYWYETGPANDLVLPKSLKLNNQTEIDLSDLVRYRLSRSMSRQDISRSGAKLFENDEKSLASIMKFALTDDATVKEKNSAQKMKIMLY